LQQLERDDRIDVPAQQQTGEARDRGVALALRHTGADQLAPL
jgi:hypothetical protein